MNRTSLCIRMLQLLKARGKMNTAQLAEALEVNPRNIREFRKELVLAGYNIEEKMGRYGGYILNDEFNLPILKFTDDEKKALSEGYKFIQTQKDFKSMELYLEAMEKIISSSKIKEDTNYYFQDFQYEIDEKEKQMVETTQRAIRNGCCVLLSYQSLNDLEPKNFEVEPYEILHYHKSYYLIGFSLLRNDYRMYRFSNQRMFKCEMSTRSFLRDSNFQLRNYIGEHSLIQNDLKEIKLRVFKSGLRLFKEKYWVNKIILVQHQEAYSDYILYTDDLYQFYRDIFSLNEYIEILSPTEVRNAYIQKLKNILHNYQK